MNTSKRSLNKNLFAAPASEEAIIRFKPDAIDILKNVEINTNDPIKVIPGVSQTSGHRAVFLKCSGTKPLVFKIELVIDSPNDFITKRFSCPVEECRFEDKSFIELANHHYTRHKRPEERRNQICCEQEFSYFEEFCEHVYLHHRKISNSVRPNFEQIRGDEYLQQNNVQFLDSFEKEVKFNDLLDLGGQIILSFGRYWIFMWNCQDFAVWYLHNLGIPLQIFDPTLSDKITGSNTDSSARKVQGFKGWAWYIPKERLQKFSSLADEPTYRCTSCDFLPPLTIEALNLHHQCAHVKR